MRWRSYLAIPVLMAVFLGLCSYPLTGSAALPEAGDRLTVSGFDADARGKGIKSDPYDPTDTQPYKVIIL